MKTVKKIALFTFFFVMAMVMFTVTAFAYIDPSSVTFIVQVVAGIVVAAGAAVGFYWRRITRWFKKKFGKNNEEDEGEYEYEEEDGEESDDEE